MQFLTSALTKMRIITALKITVHLTVQRARYGLKLKVALKSYQAAYHQSNLQLLHTILSLAVAIAAFSKLGQLTVEYVALLAGWSLPGPQPRILGGLSTASHEHRWTPGWDGIRPPRPAETSLTTWDTAAPTRTLTPWTRRHGWRGQERIEAAQ